MRTSLDITVGHRRLAQPYNTGHRCSVCQKCKSRCSFLQRTFRPSGSDRLATSYESLLLLVWHVQI